MKLMLLRELREGWRSFRFPGLALLAIFFALLEPPSQKYMDALMGMFAKGVEIKLPPATPESAFIAFAGDLTTMVLIAAIIVTMGIVAREKHNGLTEWFLTRPVSRASYVLSKAVYLVITIVAIVAVSSLICYLYTYTLLGPLSTAGFLFAVVLVATQLLLPLSLTLAVSAITGIAGAAAGAGIAYLVLAPSLSFILSASDIRWLPIHLSGYLPEVLTGSAPSSFWIAIALSWAAIIGLFLLAQYRFTRQQI